MFSGSAQPVNAHGKLRQGIEELLQGAEVAVEVRDRLFGDLPRGWDRYGDFVLLPESCRIFPHQVNNTGSTDFNQWNCMYCTVVGFSQRLYRQNG